MNTSDNLKVLQTLEKQTICNYFEKIANAPMQKLTLFSILPYTAAANLSDPHYVVLLNQPLVLASLNSGKAEN